MENQSPVTVWRPIRANDPAIPDKVGRIRARLLWLLVRERVFDRGIENGIGDGADDADACNFLLVGFTDDEAGGAADAERAGVCRVFLDRLGVLLVAQASAECRHIEAGFLAVFQDRVRP